MEEKRSVVAALALRRAGCDRIDAIAVGVGVRLSGNAPPRPLALVDAAPADAAGDAWEDLALGLSTATVTFPPARHGDVLRSSRPDFPVTLLPDRSGYARTLAGLLSSPPTTSAAPPSRPTFSPTDNDRLLFGRSPLSLAREKGRW